MFASLRLFSDRLDRAVMVLCGVLIAIMFSISLYGIAWQIVTGHALTWGTSLARLILPWIAMLSVTVAFKRGEHIAMAMFAARLPMPVQRQFSAIGLLLVTGFCLALVWYGFGFFVDSDELIMVSDFLQVPARWVTASVPVAGLVLFVHLVQGSLLLGADL